MTMMLTLPSRPIRRRRSVAAALAVLLACVVAVFGFGFGPNGSPAPAHPAVATSSSTGRPLEVAAPPAIGAATGNELAPVAPSQDPVEFAIAVSRALFAWDTTDPIGLAEYKGRLIAVADPSGVEAPGLVSDLAGYLPSTQMWDRLRTYDTRQWLEVTAALVPTSWTDAIEERPDVAAPGTYAVTITGVRHRAGRWGGEPVADQFDVAFTVFTGCAPTYPTCSLLRLTQLDKPLR